MPAALPTVTSFRALFPEFQATADAAIQTWIDASGPFFNVSRWDDLLTLGVSYWTAHQLMLAGANAAQPLTDDTTMQKAGDVSFQRDAQLVNAEAKNPYMRTAYGQQYLYYMRMAGAGGVAV